MDARPVTASLRHIPHDSAFARAELVFSISRPVGDGSTVLLWKTMPGLISLRSGCVEATHVRGLDGRAWSLVRGRGERHHWVLYAGEDFPAQQLASPDLMDSMGVRRILVQSILPLYATNRHISFFLDRDLIMEEIEKHLGSDSDEVMLPLFEINGRTGRLQN